jgi:membrane protease YdiL (CAAX protease family)
MIWYRAHQSTGFASTELIAYPLIFGSHGIAIILLLKRFFLGESLSSLNADEGSLAADILWGIGLTVIYFLLFFAARHTLSDLLAFRPNRELLSLMLDMRDEPWLVALWFGPVLWIGIALYEELVRAFLLSELWSFSENKLWISTVILIAAAVFGITHWSQGPYGVVTIAIKGIVIGAFYFYHRRLLPLVIAHVLYDGLQVGTLMLTFRRPAIGGFAP